MHQTQAPWGEEQLLGGLCECWEAFSPCIALARCVQPHVEEKGPWKQKLFWQGLENPMQFAPGILPGHFIRDGHSIWVVAVGASSSPPQTPAVESPVAALRKQRAHQPPALWGG